MRPIDADALIQALEERKEKARQAGDGLAAGLFECMAVTAQHIPTLPEAVNVFFENSLLVGGLPFEVRLPRYNRETEAAILEAREILSGKKAAKEYGSAQELFDELDAE